MEGKGKGLEGKTLVDCLGREAGIQMVEILMVEMKVMTMESMMKKMILGVRVVEGESLKAVEVGSLRAVEVGSLFLLLMAW